MIVIIARDWVRAIHTPGVAVWFGDIALMYI